MLKNHRYALLLALMLLIGLSARRMVTPPAPEPWACPNPGAVLRQGRVHALCPSRSGTPPAQLAPEAGWALGVTLDVNLATPDDLRTLPGVGDALARRVVEDRAAHGPFPSLHALRRVKGIGPATIRRLAPFIRAGAVDSGSK